MGIEQSESIEDNQLKYIDLRNALSDSVLSEAESQELTEKYYSECEEIHNEAADDCTKLQDEIALYHEIISLSQGKGGSDIEKMQILLGSQDVDGLRGPNTFALYLDASSRGLGFEGFSPRELVDRYDEIFSQTEQIFNELSDGEKRDIQKNTRAGVDGVFGSNTFKAIMKNPRDDETVKNLFYKQSNTQEEGTISEEVQSDVPSAEYIGVFQESEIPKTPGEDIDLGEMQGPEPLGEFQGPEMPDLNEIGKTEDEMLALREELRGSEEYNEARVEARSLSRDEIKNIQTATGSDIDGSFGVNTYIYYRESDLASAGFSLSEVGKLEKVVDEGETEKITQDIAEAYGIEVEDISEIFSEISPGDYFSYNTYFGKLTLFDSESGEKVTIDIAEGLFDTVENSFTDTPENAREKISNTLSRISGESERGHYIDQILSYIEENEDYEKAREILCESSDEGTYKLSLDDFGSRGKSDLILKIKAVHLYGDYDIVKKGDEAYFLDSNEYYGLSSGRRLSIGGNTEISIPSAEEKEEIIQEVEEQKRRAEITRAIEGNLQGVVHGCDTEKILGYCEFASSGDKQRLLENMKALVFEEKLFASMRIMFSRVEGDNFVFNGYSENEGVGDLFEKGLSAFELFGDYESIIVNGEEYSSGNTRRYGVSIYSGDTISGVGEQRTDEDYEKLTVRSDYNVHNMRRPQFMRNPQTGVTLCGATARVFADRIGAPGTPGGSGYAFNQFRMMPEPKAGQVPNSVRSINRNYNMGLGEIISFLENTQTLVAQIYLDAAGDYGGNYYGHVATVVLDSSGEYYVFDAYQNGGAPMKLADYYSIRRGQISAGTGQRKDFKGIAKLL